MKPLHIFLALSLVANAALLASALRLTASPARETPSPATLATDRTNAARAVEAARDLRATAAPPAASLWSRINCDDIEEFAARLKEAGFNAREISAIVTPRLFARFSPFEKGTPRPYWQFDRHDYSDPQIQETYRRNAEEQQRLIQKFWNSPELLATERDAQDAARRRFGDLSLEKLQALHQLEADYQQLSLKASMERRPRPGEAIEGDPSAAWRLLEQEKLKDVAKLLTPEELAEYELRNGPIAQRLRWQLRTFNASEQEYLAIFAVEKRYEAQLTAPNLTSAQRSGIQSDIGKELAAILGPERAEDYSASTQSPSDETSNLVQRLGLPARIAPQVRTLQKDFTAQAAAIRANPQLSATDRATQLSALAHQARAAVTAKLGAQGFEVYDDRKGEWIRALENPAPGKP